MDFSTDSTWDLPMLRMVPVPTILALMYVAFAGSAESSRADDVWSPGLQAARLTTPQWVGEPGVDCVITLAIDDMRDPAKYEAYLRPILQRLKQIDGRAPVSIMTCQVKPDDPQLQQWLMEGLSLECHTVDHPCPILAAGNLPRSKDTYDRCVELLASVPNNRPVAFRTPCCDSLNTVSPRLFSEILNRTTPSGRFLQLDSSVFTLFTPADPDIPRAWLQDPDGSEKFRKYVPRRLARGNVVHDGFVNLIENYPYPYLIGNCWEFPCMVPSDWSANHLHRPNNPDTVRDMKVAIDITVRKRGVFNLVFHPHGWIKAEQVIELIDHAVSAHGNRVRFLTFRECLDRLNRHLLNETPVRKADGSAAGIHLVDVNRDSYQDVVCLSPEGRWCRVWNPTASRWDDSSLDSGNAGYEDATAPVRFTVPPERSGVRIERFGSRGTETWDYTAQGWQHSRVEPGLMNANAKAPRGQAPIDCDLDGDGQIDRLMWVQRFDDGSLRLTALRRVRRDGAFQAASVAIALPEIPSWTGPGIRSWEEVQRTTGARLVDLDEDGALDLIVSNRHEYGAWLSRDNFARFETLIHVTRGAAKKQLPELPVIVREDGTDNGFFVRDRQLCWINEDTDPLADFKVVVGFEELLGDRLPAPRDPGSALKSMRVAPGYRIELVAHEPATQDPVALDWGPEGRLWVAEMADYPNGLDGRGQPGGRIRFLEDRDADGHYETSTVFLDGVAFPSGVLAWRKGVLVSAAPDIFYAEDTDGDGRADVRRVLFTGFAEGNQQHRVNGFSRGLDNWIYLANGDSGGKIRAVATVHGDAVEGSVDLRGRDLRIRPDTGELETVAGQTQFGRNRDDWGNWFGNNNSRPLWHFVLDDHYLRRNPHLVIPALQHDVPAIPGNAPVFPTSRTLTRFNDFHTANRFTSACSSMIYRDSLLAAPDTAAQVFISEPVHNLVHREILLPEGMSFTSARAPGEAESEFLTSTDNWFRPTQIKAGPDGALYVADMYRLVIEHPQWIPVEWQRKLDLRAGQERGRIWRIAPGTETRRPVPRLDQMSTADLVAALRHPSGWQRDLAQQLLLDRRDAAAIPLLEAQATAPGTAPVEALGRLHALCTLDGLARLDALRVPVRAALERILPHVLQDPAAGVRRHAVRVCEALDAITPAIWQALTLRVRDTDPQVRLQLAYTLGELSGPQAADLLAQLGLAGPDAEPRHDPWFDAALMSSVNAKSLSAVLAAVLERGAQDTEFQQLLLAQAVARNDDSALRDLLRRVTAPQQGEYAAWQYAALEQFLVSLDRQSVSLRDWLDRPASPAADVKTMLAAAAARAQQEQFPVVERVAAIRLLVLPEQIETVASLLGPQQPPELQQAALRQFRRLPAEAAAEILLDRYRGLSPVLRTEALDLILSRPASTLSLLTALEEQRLAIGDLDAASRQRLLENANRPVAERAGRLISRTPGPSRARIVSEYLPAARDAGDLQHGHQLFVKLCAQCHRLGNEGHAVGPDLAALTDKSPDALVTAILDPNRAVESKFLTYTAITRAGVSHSGLIAAETETSLTLRAAEGRETTLLRQELEELQSHARSLMPEGLEKDLSPLQLRSLVSYIRSSVPLPARKEFPGNQPVVVMPNSEGSFALTPTNAEIYGPTIVVEPKYGNLGWWSSADDLVAWTIRVPKPGKYQIEWTYACDPSAAGNRVTLDIGGTLVTVRVQATQSWDDYRRQPLGELNLDAGELRIVMQPASRPLPALADVTALTLTPRP